MFGTLITWLVGTAAVVLALPVVADILAHCASKRSKPKSGSDLPRFLVLVPAHNEEKNIGTCVRSLLTADYPSSRREVLVIADNCSDDTRGEAVRHGARCLERTDAVLKGKPNALAWAIQQLPLDDCDAVLVIDADTVVDDQFYRELAAFSDISEIAIQAHDATRNPDDNDLTWLSSLSGDARYHFAFPHKDRAGLNVPLTGNGICLGSTILKKRGWTAFSLTEGWELYAQYTLWGIPIRIAERALIYAEEARTLEQSRSQRERWAAGKMDVLLRYAPRLLSARHMSPLQKIDALGELTAPGPVTHFGVVAILQALLLIGWSPLAVVISIALWAGVGRQIWYSYLAARRLGETARLASAFRYLPRYLVWRLGVQLRAVMQVNSNVWVKTQRN